MPGILVPMANPSGRIGREGEHKTNEFLAAAGFTNVQREGKRAPSLDNVADDLTVPVETKRRARIDLQEWVRTLRDRHGHIWALFIHARDARKKDAMPSVMVVPAAFGASLLKLYETHKEDK